MAFSLLGSDVSIEAGLSETTGTVERRDALTPRVLPMPRAVLLAGTGAIGWATTRRLAAGGWEVVVTGRDPSHVPDGLTATGAQFVRADRDDPSTLPALLGAGADLVVDCACYTAAHAADLLAFLDNVTSTVMISTKAVYVDGNGRHSNSEDPPRFESPIAESQSTLRPNDAPYNSPQGYGPNKVAAEETLLASSYPITVLRPSKVHGAWSRQPREWHFVRRVLDGRRAVLLARRGVGADHPSAALNIAALIATVADRPGRRVLNVADPDCPDGRTIASVIARHLGHTWSEVLLDDTAPEDLGDHPWNRVPPMVLDTGAAHQLGYVPEGDYATTVADEIDWLIDASNREGRASAPAALGLRSGAPGRYDAEDDYLKAHGIAPWP